MQRARRQQIIDVASRAGNEPLGFFSSNSLADRSIDREIHNCSSAEGVINRAPTFCASVLSSRAKREISPPLHQTFICPLSQTTILSSTTTVTRSTMPSSLNLLFTL